MNSFAGSRTQSSDPEVVQSKHRVTTSGRTRPLAFPQVLNGLGSGTAMTVTVLILEVLFGTPR